MLKRFEVSNFKGFKDKLVFDLSAGKYNFNSDLVQNGIVNKAIVYGKNGTGKSNLGIALFDITSHLTDKEHFKDKYLINYLNIESRVAIATFVYYFQFDKDEVVYEYGKGNPYNLVYEKLTINGKEIVYYDYYQTRNNRISNDFIGDLNINLIGNRLSVLKYIYHNTQMDDNSPFIKMMKYVNNMLWYRSLSEGNTYAGYTNGGSTLVYKLYESGKIKDFEKFLNENGLDFKLDFKLINGVPELFAKYPNNRMAQFVSLASTGTMALFLFYIWSIDFNKISLLFIDEFDAFFHYESAENIVNRLNASKSFQTILTSHNVYLMQNKLTRPDCCYIMTKNKITSLSNATDKEIREAHNLEKMYINGAFCE